MKNRYILLQKGPVTLVIDKVGAQLVSYQINGVEIMYQGALDPKKHAWQATAKNLFPNPGPVAQEGTEPEIIEVEKNGKKVKQTIYTHNGGVYSMGQHGFAQYRTFKVQGHQPSNCYLTTRADEETITEYPYDFKYDVGYEINEDGSLTYESHVNNLDNKPILAGMGWHPGFQLHDTPSNYYVVFENLKGEKGCTVKAGKKYPISEIVKNGHASSFTGIVSADVKLVYVDKYGKHVPYIQMHTESPVFLLWGKNDDMICMEPWNTTPRQISKLTTQDKTIDLEKEGARILYPQEVDTLSCTVSVNTRYLDHIAQNEPEKDIDDESMFTL